MQRSLASNHSPALPLNQHSSPAILSAWSRLTRDTRDTFFLLAVIGWTVMPHLGHLPSWCTALTVSVLAWRARLAWTGGALPGRWATLAVLAAVLGLTFWSYGSVLGKEPGVAMAVSLMALKTLELRARRDAFVVFFLGFFLIITHFVYSQSLLLAAAMLVSTWGLLTALVLAHMPVGQPSLRLAAGLAARTALWGAPIMVMLFVLFPRVGPLWGVPQDGAVQTGLSNQMRMGSMAEIAQSDAVALRLRFKGPPPDPADQYFRGPVLSRYDGQLWLPLEPTHSTGERPYATAPLTTDGPGLLYEMTVEPLRLSVLPLLEATAQTPKVDGNALTLTMQPDMQWSAGRNVYEHIRLNAVAYPRFRHGQTSRMSELQEFLALPPGYNPRTLEWARSLRRQAPDANPTQLAQMLYEHIRTQGYSYTLAPGRYGINDARSAIDEFWLDRKEGFCEHFAASFVIAMRGMGIPARIVTGFQGMDPLPVDGYFLVRQSSAHAWAEYWQAGEGWVRADPTAAIAPDRIRSNLRLQPAPGLMGSALNAVSPNLLLTLRNTWESINNRWNQWVLNYTRNQQLDMLKQLGFKSPSWEDLGILLISAISILALLGSAWAWWDRHHINPWIRQFNTIRQALRQRGIPVMDSDPPLTMAHRLLQHSPGWAPTLQAHVGPLISLLEQLDQQRYGPAAQSRPNPELTRRFLALIKLMPSAPAHAR